jgi:hypothetical protein
MGLHGGFNLPAHLPSSRCCLVEAFLGDCLFLGGSCGGSCEYDVPGTSSGALLSVPLGLLSAASSSVVVGKLAAATPSRASILSTLLCITSDDGF